MPARRSAAVLFVVALLLAPGCGLFLRVAPRISEVPPAGAVLPAHRCSNAFLVEVTINGRGPFTLLLDTGAGLTAVSPAVAAQLESDRGRTFTQVIGATGKTANVSGKLHIDTLRAGDLVLRDFEALVMETDGFEVIMGGRFDGVLGYPSFRDLTLTLDYPGGQARVSSAPLEARDGDLPISGKDVPRVGFKLGDRYIGAIIDSGSGGEIALGPRSADIAFATKPVPAGSTLALGGTQIRLLGRAAEDATLAGVTLRRPLIETDAALNLIGTEVLKHFTLTLDARSGLARFEPQSPGPVEFEPLLGIGIGAAPREGAIRITDVFKGSPAELAGLRVGDEVVALEGRPIAELICERARLFARTGPAVLTVRRDGAEIQAPVDVEVMVP
jgi:hypothetical protein